MLVVLALRFRRHIACFFYLLFYAQWVAAAELHRHDAVGSRIRPVVERADVRLPVISAPRNTPAFGLPRAPLANAHPATTSAARSTTAIGGPNQPEMQSFTPAGANNMVDMFSGDFSYNIPLLDVGGYPVNIAQQPLRTFYGKASGNPDARDPRLIMPDRRPFHINFFELTLKPESFSADSPLESREAALLLFVFLESLLLGQAYLMGLGSFVDPGSV
jgi:hypothetical protein